MSSWGCIFGDNCPYCNYPQPPKEDPMPCSCETPDSPDLKAGDKIHRRLKENSKNRVGGAEVYVIQYISSQNVIYNAYRSDGTFISQCHENRNFFDAYYERCNGPLISVTDRV